MIKTESLHSKEAFRNGEKNVYDNSLTATFYSPAGKITEISNYKFDKLHGETKTFHEDGKSVKQMGQYENGVATENGKYFIHQERYSVKRNLPMTNGTEQEFITVKTEALKKQRSTKTEN
jgi:antitoxin component YwqK of YwqJK toxin-antitoxin module